VGLAAALTRFPRYAGYGLAAAVTHFPPYAENW
jgi:hypothetical protein